MFPFHGSLDSDFFDSIDSIHRIYLYRNLLEARPTSIATAQYLVWKWRSSSFCWRRGWENSFEFLFTVLKAHTWTIPPQIEEKGEGSKFSCHVSAAQNQPLKPRARKISGGSCLFWRGFRSPPKKEELLIRRIFFSSPPTKIRGFVEDKLFIFVKSLHLATQLPQLPAIAWPTACLAARQVSGAPIRPTRHRGGTGTGQPAW